jgi:hypothetical protein
MLVASKLNQTCGNVSDGQMLSLYTHRDRGAIGMVAHGYAHWVISRVGREEHMTSCRVE